ncbi:MAG TPA: histidinol phosphatase [Acidimicrobiaceae bacterium]|nr:histidinol phosphatase [Actinomycetota bacterium]HAZ33735.1 histidinol phosphatase [Acidimicrobiaceae bacterium]
MQQRVSLLCAIGALPNLGDGVSTSASAFGDDLSLALELADLCDAVTLPAFENRLFEVEYKSDRSEVTEADREAERQLSERLLAARPDHGLFGEEHGVTGNELSPWQWIVDPIDGTSGFTRGIPIWATLIALHHADDGLCVSVVSAPALGRRWWATKGGGAWADGRQCAVSGVDNIDDAQVNVTLNDGWRELGHAEALIDLTMTARRSRGVGDFWQHCLVAEGAMDIAIDAVGVQPYDLAAVRLLVEEAGGSFTNHLGEPSHAGPTAISSNGVLHSRVLERL